MDEDAKFDGIVKDKKKLLNLIAALKKHTVYETINSILLEIDNENAGSPPSQGLIQADYDLVILTQALTELHKDIVLFIIQQCEWMNNCAFNYCELNFNIEKAEQYSLNAVELMTKLIPISENLKIPNLRVRLAQFYDTLAWIHYRKGVKGSLNKAFVFLNQHAMKHDQESPLIYYHLARIRLSQIESIWQESFSAGVKRTGISNHKSSMISNYLRDAFLYWRHAHRLDKEKNLYMRLRIVRLRIDQYRKNWEEINRPALKEKQNESKN